MPKRLEHSITPLPGLPHYRFLDELAALPFVEAIYLYGSRARGDADEWSDVDLAIVAPNASSEDWNDLSVIVDEAPVLLNIDCVRYDTLKEGVFKNQIDRYKKVLYAQN